MSAYKLTYFDIATSRGEECRLALFVAGIPFEDERLKSGEWSPRKAATPFGALPVLTVEGKGAIAQSNAILRFIGSQHGLHPADPFEAARHEAIMGAVEDLRGRLAPVVRIKDEPERQRAREEFAAGYMQEWGGYAEKQLGEGPFLAGAALSVADLKLFVALGTFAKGIIDHIPATVFHAFPKLMRLTDAVKQHPKVVAWYARPRA
jgi:glutathione S-transferase